MESLIVYPKNKKQLSIFKYLCEEMDIPFDIIKDVKNSVVTTEDAPHVIKEHPKKNI
jgi:sporulation protein YlmC with PRC-barrel domain